MAVVGSDPGQIGTTLSAIQAYILGELNADCEVRPSYVVLFGDTSHVPTWHVPCTDGGDVAECDIASDLPYSLDFPSDLFADVMLGRIPARTSRAPTPVVSKIVNYETAYPAPPGDDFYGHATVTAFFEPKYLCILNDGETRRAELQVEERPRHRSLRAGLHEPQGHARVHKDRRDDPEPDDRRRHHHGPRLHDGRQHHPETYYDGTPIPDFLESRRSAGTAPAPIS